MMTGEKRSAKINASIRYSGSAGVVRFSRTRSKNLMPSPPLDSQICASVPKGIGNEKLSEEERHAEPHEGAGLYVHPLSPPGLPSILDPDPSRARLVSYLLDDRMEVPAKCCDDCSDERSKARRQQGAHHEPYEGTGEDEGERGDVRDRVEARFRDVTREQVLFKTAESPRPFDSNVVIVDVRVRVCISNVGLVIRIDSYMPDSTDKFRAVPVGGHGRSGGREVSAGLA